MLDLQFPYIRFEYKSDALTRQSIDDLDLVKFLMSSSPQLRLEVAGHTDSVGGSSYNMELSRKRAQQVLEHLVNNGATRNRLRTRGYGLSQPVDTNKTDAGRAANRRVTFRALKP